MSRPEISLGVSQPKYDTPQENLQKALTLKSLLQSGQERDQQLRLGKQQEQMNQTAMSENAMKARQMARAEKGQQVYADAVKNAVKVGDDGDIHIDHPAIISALVQAGYPELADQHKTQTLEMDKKAYEATEKEMDVRSKKIKELGSLAQSVLNAGTPEAKSTLYTGALNQAVASKLIDPQEAAQLPKEWTPEVDTLLQQMSDHAASDPFAALQARAKEKRDAAAAELDTKNKTADLEKKSLESESMKLGAAKTPEAWAAALETLPPERRKLYPPVFTEDARKNAVFMGMSPEAKEKVGKASSETELAQMAARGEPGAREAMKLLRDQQVSIEEGKKRAEFKVFAPSAGTTPAGQQAVATMGGKNEGILSGIEPGIAATVRKLASYDMPMPGGMALRSPYWQNLLGLVEQYDPSFSVPQYGIRYGMRQDFTSGKSALNVRALNTVTKHLDEMNKAVDQLGNVDGDNIGATAINAIKNSVTNNKAVNNFNVARDAVANELENAFRGSGSESGVQTWRKNFSGNQAPSVLKDAVKEAVKLMGGRIESLRDQYARGMGSADDFQILDDKSRTILSKLGLDANDIDPVAKKATPAPSGDKVITEQMITTGLNTKANKDAGVTRQQLIDALKQKGYKLPNE